MRAAARPSTRSLAPREHGAYGQLGLPLVAALGMGRPTGSAVCFAVASVALFLAHEPVLILFGQRGTRAAREDSARARRLLAILGAVAALTGSAALLLAPAAAIHAAAVPLGLGVVLAWLIARGAEKTAAGEVLAAGALAGAGLPVAIAAGVTPERAFGAWAAWCLGFGASTLAVRSVIAHARAPVAPLRRLLAPMIAIGVAAALWASGVLRAPAAIGVAPLLALSLGLAARPPSPRSLRRVGWALVAASFALAIALVAGRDV